MKKIVIIGSNHAGLAAINVIVNSGIEAELVVFDKNSNLSYLGCGTSLFVGKQVESVNNLFYTSKDAYETKSSKIHINTEINKIDFIEKVVYAENQEKVEIKTEYDELILATGANPIELNLEGRDLKNIHTVKIFQDCQVVDQLLEDEAIQNIVVIGAGAIGIEMAEAVKRRGKSVDLIEKKATCMSNYFDPWFSEDMDACLMDNDIHLHYLEEVLAFQGEEFVEQVVTNKAVYQADLVLIAIGFQPNTGLGKNKIRLSEQGAFKVNLKQETNLPSVYAIGDCATIYSNALEKDTYIPRATNAVRSGMIAGSNISGIDLESTGTQGTTGISIFGYNMVATGLNLSEAKKARFDVLYTEFEDLQKPIFMEENHSVKVRIVYDKNTRRILGAQLASYHDISMGIHFFSLAIEEKVTIDKLKLTDIFFLPHFNQPYNYITMAALGAK